MNYVGRQLCETQQYFLLLVAHMKQNKLWEQPSQSPILTPVKLLWLEPKQPLLKKKIQTLECGRNKTIAQSVSATAWKSDLELSELIGATDKNGTVKFRTACSLVTKNSSFRNKFLLKNSCLPEKI